jgi:hypothetical protein
MTNTIAKQEHVVHWIDLHPNDTTRSESSKILAILGAVTRQ